MHQAPHLPRIRECYPDLDINQLQLDADGLVNQVLIINNERVFRFPKDDQARAALRRETAVLKIVHRHVSMAVPHFDRIEEDFVSYPLIPGRALMYQDLFNFSGLELDRIAEQIAIFLQQLHGVPVVEIEAAGIGASISCHSSDDWQKLYQAVEQELFPVMPTHIRHWVEYWFSPYHENPSWMKNPRKVLVNGDLGPYHILYDDVHHTINGIIDFGTAGLGDPAVDFAVLLYNFGESFLKRIHHTYPLGEDVLDRARFWAGTVELQWALAGIRTRDCSWFLGHLGSARDIKPVGTPW